MALLYIMDYVQESHACHIYPQCTLPKATIQGMWAYTIERMSKTHLRAGSHGVPNPTHASKSQHGGKVPTCEPPVTTKICLIIIKIISWLLYAKIFTGLGLRARSSFMLDPTCNTSPRPRLLKVLPCRHPCHSWDLGLGTPCEVVGPNFHAFNG